MILVRAAAGGSTSIAACSEFAVALMIEHGIRAAVDGKIHTSHIHAIIPVRHHVAIGARWLGGSDQSPCATQ